MCRLETTSAVCLSPRPRRLCVHKTDERISTKLVERIERGPKQKPWNFGTDRDKSADPRIFHYFLYFPGNNAWILSGQKCHIEGD